MSTRRVARGRGRGCRGARAGSSASGYMPDVEAREAQASPVAEIGSFDRAIGDNALAQAMLHILERVAGTVGSSIVTWVCGSVMERLRPHRVENFRGVSRVVPSVAEYWLEATKRILDNLDYTPEQKLKGAVSLLRDEAYQWWLMVKEGTSSDRLTWEFFRSTFQGKYVGASYVDASRKEFLSLVQGDGLEYEAKFLRLSQYAQGIVATENDRCVQF
ncbi:uncharacterized protein LOC108477800 [Gossypium arboreum]|uniref:uncharacterized protein LOC108477800 n=1 Tax=Gossypium arboreum TaxID=29729 RepID=UPI00081939BC|nr:uncharacterized protein LOC108477800 [Gossypium arboreum]